MNSKRLGDETYHPPDTVHTDADGKVYSVSDHPPRMSDEKGGVVRDTHRFRFKVPDEDPRP